MPLDEATLERLLGHEWRERIPPICPECGYNLTGLPDNRCPECGYVYSRQDVARNARNMVYQLQALRDVNEILKVGLYLGGAAALFFIAARLTGTGGILVLARIACVFMGLPTIGLGLQVFRVKRLPPWAREFVPTEPHYGRGAATAALGLLLILAALLVP